VSGGQAVRESKFPKPIPYVGSETATRKDCFQGKVSSIKETGVRILPMNYDRMEVIIKWQVQILHG